MPEAIRITGARVHNLRDLDVNIPLHRLVVVTGVSGSGKSSLAMGVLYAEGSRRYLDGLSAYTRRRISQVARPDADRIDFLPAAVALRQNPPIPGRRSTVGTLTEVLNVMRLMFSRLGTCQCPNGHLVEPSLARSGREWIDCPQCSVHFAKPSAESFSFNTLGRCPACDGIGTVDEIDDTALIPDPSKSIQDGAVAPWNLAGRSYMPQVAAELGVRLDVPFRELSSRERELVLDGPQERHTVTLTSKAGRAVTLRMVFESARATVRNAAAKASTETTRQRLSRFFTTSPCPVCHGSRLRPEALIPQLAGRDLGQTSTQTLDELIDYANTVPIVLPGELRPLAVRLTGELTGAVQPLRELGLGYLGLDRAAATLSTGERQRIQLATTLRSRSTGMLYVLDEPSVGLHPANVDGLRAVLRGINDDGNTVVVVDHDVAVMREADHLLELGPGAGRHGGTVIAEGTLAEISANPASVTGPYLSGAAPLLVRERRPIGTEQLVFAVDRLYTLRDVTARIPVRRLTAVTGVSGSGKTALILDSLVPALTQEVPPRHVRLLDRSGITALAEVDASPIGINARSTPATYSGAFDAIRALYAAESGLEPGVFSYNTRAGQCPTCEGLGELAVDIQYLPDLHVSCPECHGGRYRPEALKTTVAGLSIAEVLGLSVDEAVGHFSAYPRIVGKLKPMAQVGLGYLGLGEPTPALSGGEAQRLRLSTRLRSRQKHVLYVFDEPSIGLHPQDVRVLLGVLDRLIHAGATVVVIDHDLDLIANADHVIDMGPGGGPAGGRIVATGTPEEIVLNPDSQTGHWLRKHVEARLVSHEEKSGRASHSG